MESEYYGWTLCDVFVVYMNAYERDFQTDYHIVYSFISESSGSEKKTELWRHLHNQIKLSQSNKMKQYQDDESSSWSSNWDRRYSLSNNIRPVLFANAGD